jgi:GTP 3',8-cyclase
MVDYLRLSLTDRCNLNCAYCTPREKLGRLAHADLLRHEELALAAAAFAKAGVRKIRLTGGEPLSRRNLAGLVRLLRGIKGLRELALTTNGVLLAEQAGELKAAGLDTVNISLNTLDRAVYQKITGVDAFACALAGLEAALAAGFKKVKLNAVLLRGINDGEAVRLAGLARSRPLDVRFIEYFSTNARSGRFRGAVVPTAETRAALEAAFGPLRRLPRRAAGGPAENFSFKGARGSVGFISNHSGDFCGACTRLRLDCLGRVYPCLFGPAALDLRAPLRAGAGLPELAALLRETFLVKSLYNRRACAGPVEMSDIGG